MSSHFWRNLLWHLSRLALGLIFLYAGLSKVGDVAAFAEDITNYRVLPYAWSYLSAGTLPYAEVLAGVLLVAGIRTRPASLFLGGLTVFFIVLLSSALWRGLDVACGCFGQEAAAGPQGLWNAIYRDIGILVLFAIVFFEDHIRPKGCVSKRVRGLFTRC